jgi:hypothetical protein
MTVREVVGVFAAVIYLSGLLVLALGSFSWSQEPAYWVAVGVAFVIPIGLIMKAKPDAKKATVSV